MAELFEPKVHVSLARQIQCVERELKFRRSVYERRIANGQMTRDFAENEIACMNAVLDTLKKLA